MSTYDLLDIALKISLSVLGILVGVVCLYLIMRYIRIITDHALERKRAREEEAEMIAKNIYGED